MSREERSLARRPHIITHWATPPLSAWLYHGGICRRGTYTLVPDPAMPLIHDPGGRKKITVKAGEFTVIELHFDTGMR